MLNKQLSPFFFYPEPGFVLKLEYILMREISFTFKVSHKLNSNFSFSHLL